jgi:hypothetical protein
MLLFPTISSIIFDMPVVARNFEALPHSAFFSARFNSVFVSGLHYYSVKSGKRNLSKNDWRGFVSEGAVKAKLNKSGHDFDGLPVPMTLLRNCPGLAQKTGLLGDEKAPWFALAVDSVDSTRLFVALPLETKSHGRLDRPLNPKVLSDLIPISDHPGEHSLQITELTVLSIPAQIRIDRHDRDAVIPTVPHLLDVSLSRDTAIEKVKLPREVNSAELKDIPTHGLAEPYFSVFYDDRGVLLFFVEHPEDEGILPAPDGIVESQGFRWRRRQQLRSLSNMTAKDIKPPAAQSPHNSDPNLSRPWHPETIDDWLVDSEPPPS